MRTLDALFTRVGRLQFILLAGIFLGFVAIGQSFVVLWGGDEKFAVDYWTTLLLFFSCLWTNVQTVGIEIQRAKNMHKFRSLVYLGVALGNAAISIPLCIRWEGLGAAIGTAVATLIGNVILMNWYYYPPHRSEHPRLLAAHPPSDAGHGAARRHGGAAGREGTPRHPTGS